MSQTFSQTLVHIVFSTKCRHPFINETIRPQLHAYLATVLRSKQSFVYNIGGTSDHVHILCCLPKDLTQIELLKVIKSLSSKWMKEQGFKDFYWQRGYGIFSVSNNHRQRVNSYIEHQVEHHKIMTYQEELLCFLKENELSYDERYIWD